MVNEMKLKRKAMTKEPQEASFRVYYSRITRCSIFVSLSPNNSMTINVHSKKTCYSSQANVVIFSSLIFGDFFLPQ